MQIPTPQKILDLDQVFNEAVNAVLHYEKRISELNASLYQVIPKPYKSLKASSDAGETIKDEVRNFVGFVHDIATEELSVPGSPYNRDKVDLLEGIGQKAMEIWRRVGESDRDEAVAKLWASATPLWMWKQIVLAHDPEEQLRQAARSAASDIAGAFGLHRRRAWGQTENTEMKVVKGKVEVPINAYTEKSFSRPSERRLSNGETFLRLAKSFGIFTEQCMGGLNLSFHRGLADKIGSLGYHNPVISRERTALGDGVELVTGYEQFKLYLPQNIAGALNLFIAEHDEQ